MDVPALRVVRAVAEDGSVSAAARTLNCVQSNVTARLKRLEAELGTPLFHRASRGMVPTEAGRVLADYAGRVLHLIEQARTAVADVAEHGGALRIGSMETTAAVRLPPVLARFHRAHPRVELTIVPGPSEQLLAEVLAFRLDGAFVGGAVDHPELLAEPAFVEELVLVGPPDGAAAARRTLLAFRRGCAYRARAESALRETGAVPYRVMEFGALDAILGCVAAGMGVTVLPRAVVEREPWRGMVAARPLPGGLGRMPTSFVRRADAVGSRALAAFLAAARGGGGGAASEAPTRAMGLQRPDAPC
ncbi:LysR substrate-binding domain-containing protein [Azospirillum sp. ST 5-10]|uniref:LysR family transcriptional regulator n=1 Tax=unclassified Azospirillum TaxID=2630922 RepID=UPI003F49EE2F